MRQKLRAVTVFLIGLLFLDVIAADCPAGTVLGQGGQCVCQAGSYSPFSDAVVAFNPANEVFDGSSTYYDLGTMDFNIAALGFTAVVKVKYTATGEWARVFDFGDGANNAGDIIYLGQYSTGNQLIWEIHGGSAVCTLLDGTIVNNQWMSIYVRYDANSNEIDMIIDGVPYGPSACTPRNDRTLTHTYIGQAYTNVAANRLHGEIAGLYTFNRFLSDDEAQAVLDLIKVGGLDDPLQTSCTSCGLGLTTLEPGAESKSACVCQAGSYSPFSDARDCTVYDFTGTNSLSSFQAYATSVGISTSLDSWHDHYGGGVWVGGTTVGWIQIPLITGYDTVSIEYGHAHVENTVTLCLCSTTGVTCDNSQCEIKQTPSPNTMSTFSTKYVPGGSIVIQEGHSVISDNIFIKFTNGPNCHRLFPGISDAVVAFNPANEVFDGLRTEDTGAARFEIATHGFTAVMKVKFADDTAWPRIFDFGNANEAVNNNIFLGRSSDTKHLYARIDDGSTVKCESHAAAFDAIQTWLPIYMRYNTLHGLSVTILDQASADNSAAPVACTVSNDRNVPSTKIGKSQVASENTFRGEIAGVYAFNRYLSDEEAKAVLATIQTGALDDPLHTACMGCPVGSTTLTANASRLQDCLCQAGSYSPFSDAVVAFNPANEVFGASTTPYDLGPVTVGGGANGFTIVAKIKFGTNVRYERVFAFMPSGGASQNIGDSTLPGTVMLRRRDELTSFRAVLTLPSGATCGVNTLDVTTDQFYSFVLRYNPNRGNFGYVEMTFDTTETEQQCTETWTAQTWEYTYVGKSNHASYNDFRGEIAGLYAFNRYLSVDEAEAVLDLIQVGDLDDQLQTSCTRCGAGLTTLSVGALRAEDCVCQRGSFFQPAKIFYNPSGGAQAFPGTALNKYPGQSSGNEVEGTDYIDFGPLDWNIASNGGFTAVGKFKTHSSSNHWMRVFELFDTFSESQTWGIAVLQLGTGTGWRQSIYVNAQFSCVSETVTIPDNTVNTFIMRYDAASSTLYPTFNGVDQSSVSCSVQVGDYASLPWNMIAAPAWNNNYLHGEIYGVIAYDYFLTKERAQDVLNGIKTDTVNAVKACARCPAGQTTLSAGALRLDDCVCESGSFTAVPRVAFNPSGGYKDFPGTAGNYYPGSTDASNNAVSGTDYVNLGPLDLKIASHGGFTAVGKFKPHTSNRAYERVFDFADAYASDQHIGIGVLRSATSGSFYQTLKSGVFCSSDAVSISANEETSFMMRYDATTSTLYPTFNGVDGVSKTCTFFMPDLLDLPLNFIAAPSWNDAYFDGEIYGVYAYDHFLSKTEAQAILDGIKTGTDNTVGSTLENYCTHCRPEEPYTDPNHGATSADECAAVTGSCEVVDVTIAPNPFPIRCSSHKFCVQYDEEANNIFCYGSSSGCLWNTNDCSTDTDCLKYDKLSPRYGDDPGYTCYRDVPNNYWQQGACDKYNPLPDLHLQTGNVTSAMVKYVVFNDNAITSPYTLTFSAETTADILVISGSHYRYVTNLPVSGAYTITVSSTGESSFLGANSFGVTSGGGLDLVNDGVTRGLIAHWKFDGDFVDATGSYTLTTTGTEFVHGHFGEGIYVDSTDTFYTTSNFVVGPTSQNTFSFWVKKGRNNANDFLLYISADVAAHLKARKEIGVLFNSNNKINFYIHSGGDLITTTEYTDLTTWMHIVAVLDNEDQKIYVNAQLEASQVLSNKLDAITDSPLRNSRPGNPNQLYYDDFRVYDRVLTDTEITALYQAGARIAITGELQSYSSPQVIVQFHALACPDNTPAEPACTAITPTTDPAVSAVEVAGADAEKYLVFESNQTPHTITFPESPATTGEVLVVSSSTYTHVQNVDLSGEYTVTVGADASVVTDAAGAVVATSAGGTEYQLPRWVLGAGGATCDDTCANVNMACDSATQNEVDTQDEVDNIAEELGISCTNFYGRSYAGVPFVNEQNQCYYVDLGHTWAAGPPKISASVCNDNAQSSSSELFLEGTLHRPICRCVPATTGFDHAITGVLQSYSSPQVIVQFHALACLDNTPAEPACTAITPTTDSAVSAVEVAGADAEKYLVFESNPAPITVSFPESPATTGEVLVVSGTEFRHISDMTLFGEYTVTVGADTSVVTDAAGAVVATSAGGQEYVGIESARDATSAYNIDGGGWTLVRRTAGPNWHPTTDELLGEISYGTHSTNEKSLETFSIPFSDKLTSTTEFLFATGDGTDATNGCDELWLVATIENIGGKVYQSAGGTLITYANEARNFITKHGATSAKWYNRAAYDWEPIISVIDYDQAITSGKLVYLGNGDSGYNDNIATCNGMNVFIRNGAGPSINVDSAITGTAQAYAKPQVILRYKSEVCPATDNTDSTDSTGDTTPEPTPEATTCCFKTWPN